MKIAVLTSGLLPVPASQGGAVENLVDFYLDFNERNKLHQITVFSVSNGLVSNDLSLGRLYTHYVHFRTDRLWYKLKRKIFGFLFKSSFYYHFHIEYFLYRSLKKIKNEKFDLIILENRPGYAIKVAKISPQSRVVLHLHNDLLMKDSKEASTIKSQLASIITVSDYIRNRVDEVEPVITTNTCYNGIDLSLFNTEMNRYHLRKDLGIKENEFVVVFTGRLIPEKGVKELLQAMHYLDIVPIKLLIIGSDFFGNNNLKTDYIKALHRMALDHKDQIIFTGFKPYRQIPGFLQCADVFVIPSLWEDPCPLSCIEGMASALPMIITSSGGMPELVDNRCALILDKSSVDLPLKIAEAITYLYLHPEVRGEMSTAAAKRSFLFSKERFAENFFKLLE